MALDKEFCKSSTCLNYYNASPAFSALCNKIAHNREGYTGNSLDGRTGKE
jgi:hypothetical protein